MYRLASFFAGVGGIDLGFWQTGCVETVYANENDNYPAQTFELNFPIGVTRRDIRDIGAEEVPDIDICVGGFPCQPFSIAGRREGFKDANGRGTLFFEFLRIISGKKPRVIFLENVKALATHNNGDTLRTILDALKRAGYYCAYRVINAMDTGNTPQNRERIYIVGFREEKDYEKFSFPTPIPLQTKLSDIIDFEGKTEDKYYYTPGKYKGNIYSELARSVTASDTVYQWRRRYVRANRKNVVPTLTANMGGGGHNVPLILTKHGIRKLTPRECFNAQGFPKDFRLPAQSDSRLYRQAGNSVCVNLVRRIAESIVKAIDSSQ